MDSKKGRKNKIQMPTEINGFKIPAWWECQWRRVPCGKDSCAFCGRLKKLEHLMDDEGILEDPEEENDVHDQLRKVVHYQAKDLGISDEFGEDSLEKDDLLDSDEIEHVEGWPPKPEKFLLYRLVNRWSQPIGHVFSKAEEEARAWSKKEEAQDLAWYSAVLPGKVYRQLSTRWEVRHAPKGRKREVEEFARVELVYTSYVLREIIEIIENSLLKLGLEESVSNKAQFLDSLKRFRRFKGSILDIASP